MKNNSYNLENVFFFKIIAPIFIVSFLMAASVSAEDAKVKKKEDPEFIITAEDKDFSWQAIVSVGKGKKKIYTKGDIFCSEIDITDCLRIEDIRKDTLILKDVESGEIVTVKAGNKIPIGGIRLIFEKAIQMNAMEHTYHESKQPIILEDKDI